MKVDAIRKIGYSFIGLLAGNVAALIGMTLVSASETPGIGHVLPQAWHLGLRSVLPLFAVFAAVSLLGWAVIGIPALLALPARTAAQFSWPLFTPLGIFLGPLTLFALFLAFAGGDLGAITGQQAFPALLPFFCVATLISGVAFTVYCYLVRRALRSGEAESQPSDPTFSVVKREIL